MGDERGAVLILVAAFLTVALMLAAFVIDIGHSYVAKRALQRSADAAALAGAYDLDKGNEVARAMAMEYSGTVGKRNHTFENTTTAVYVPGDPGGQANKVIVEESAKIESFFGMLWGKSDWTVNARAVAARPSETITTVVQGDAKMAVFTNNNCTANGFEAAGDRMRIEDNIHSNGRFKVGNPGFDNSKASTRATVWRGTGQSGDCKDDNAAAGQYGEIGSTNPKFTGGATRPAAYPTRRYWPSGGPAADPATDPYVEVSGLPRMAAPASEPSWSPTQRIKCTHTSTSITGSSPDGVYCTSSKATVDITGSAMKRITVIAPEVEVKGASNWSPHCLKTATYTPPSSACKSDTEPLLIYDRAGQSEMVINTSSASNWSGFIINRTGNIIVNNSSAMTSPLMGYLEATWIKVNGADFWMQGTSPDPTDYREETKTVWEPDWELTE